MDEDVAPSRARKVALSLLLLAFAASTSALGVFGAFSATTGSTGNQLATGTVAIHDDDAGTVLYDVADLAPGRRVERCIAVTYAGSLPADVRLHLRDDTGALGPFVELELTAGTQASPTFPACSGFTADGPPLYAGSLAGFRARHHDWDSGLRDLPGTATAWRAGTTAVYRLRAEVRDDNAARGLATGVHAFVWEARNQEPA